MVFPLGGSEANLLSVLLHERVVSAVLVVPGRWMGLLLCRREESGGCARLAYLSRPPCLYNNPRSVPLSRFCALLVLEEDSFSYFQRPEGSRVFLQGLHSASDSCTEGFLFCGLCLAPGWTDIRVGIFLQPVDE